MRYTFLLFFALFWIVACEPPTAAQRVTSTEIIGTAQSDQYARDAQATESARQATVTAEAYQAASTQSAVTQTQVWVDQQATAQAYAAQYTQAAVATQAAYQATREAGAAMDATATAAAIIRADATSTAQAEQMATATAAVVQTQTAIGLQKQQSDADVAYYVSIGVGAGEVILGAVCIVLVLGFGVVWIRRLQVVYYGLHKNPLVLIGGDVFNPLTQIWSGKHLPAPVQEKISVLAMEMLMLQAQHDPHPPVALKPSVKTDVRLGPLGVTREQVTVTGVPPTPLPEKPKTEKLAPPEQRTHIMYAGGMQTDEKTRDLCDMREFLERGLLRGFARDGNWLNYKFQSGHICDRDRYDWLCSVMAKAEVLDVQSKPKKMLMTLPDAIKRCNLETVALD